MFRAFSGWLAGCVVATVVVVGLPLVFALSEHPRASLTLASISKLLGPSLLQPNPHLRMHRLQPGQGSR